MLTTGKVGSDLGDDLLEDLDQLVIVAGQELRVLGQRQQRVQALLPQLPLLLLNLKSINLSLLKIRPEDFMKPRTILCCCKLELFKLIPETVKSFRESHFGWTKPSKQVAENGFMLVS
jgi:hypothetical protein